jgi:hypothetical protein
VWREISPIGHVAVHGLRERKASAPNRGQLFHCGSGGPGFGHGVVVGSPHSPTVGTGGEISKRETGHVHTFRPYGAGSRRWARHLPVRTLQGPPFVGWNELETKPGDTSTTQHVSEL